MRNNHENLKYKSQRPHNHLSEKKSKQTTNYKQIGKQLDVVLPFRVPYSYNPTFTNCDKMNF